MKNKYLYALLGVALAVGVGYFVHEKTNKKGCGCGCGGSKKEDLATDSKMANAIGSSKRLSTSGCTICEGASGGYWSVYGQCKSGDKCKR